MQKGVSPRAAAAAALGGSGGAAGVRPASSAAEVLCRIEARELEALSLPLRTRQLPNGDEIAERTAEVVMHLAPAENSVATPATMAAVGLGLTTPQAETLGAARGASGGGCSASSTGAGGGLGRVHLWLRCETNTARGELVEWIAQWHLTQPGTSAARSPVPGFPPDEDDDADSSSGSSF
ncbi:unnamed protein product, partial [Phaeothamnion confervicola]